MAKQVVTLCDGGEGTCKNAGQTYRVWKEGDKQATAIDLCDEHAKPLTDLLGFGVLTDLPAKPRMRMEVTKLKTTPATAHLKKR